MDSSQKPLSIGEVSEMTGVNTVTLRAWQRRYGLLKPQRTDKGHRLYSAQDIKRIEAILSWLDKGVPVSKVKELLDNRDTLPQNVDRLPEWDALKEMVINFDLQSVENTLLELTKNYPISVLERTLFAPLSDWFESQNSEVMLLCNQCWCAVVKDVLVRCLHHSQKVKGKLPCWLIGVHGNLDYRFYLTALILERKGYAVTTVEGVNTGLKLLYSSLREKGVEKLVLYSDVSLSASLKRDVQSLIFHTEMDVVIEGASATIHPELAAPVSDKQGVLT